MGDTPPRDRIARGGVSPSGQRLRASAGRDRTPYVGPIELDPPHLSRLLPPVPWRREDDESSPGFLSQGVDVLRYVATR